MATNDVSAAALLGELSLVHHDKRVARLIELGKRSVNDAKARGEIEALVQSTDAFARAMAVWTAFGSKDGGLVLRAIHDVSARVRRLAFRLVAIVCDDMQAFDALQVAYGTRKDKSFLLGLHAQERYAAVDRGIDWLAERPGIHDFADVVPLGSKYAIKKHLDRALARPSVIFWERLARNHADMLGDILCQRIQAAGSGESDPITRQLVQKHHVSIARGAPKQGLAIASLLAAREIHSDSGIWNPLAKTHLGDVLDFFDRHHKGVAPIALSIPEERVLSIPLDVLARAARMGLTLKGKIEDLPDDRQRTIADAWAAVAKENASYGTNLLRWVSNPELRSTAFAFWRAGSMTNTGTIWIPYLNRLPLDLREQEGRRHIYEVNALKTQPGQRIPYAQYLPFDEAKKVIDEYLGHPEGTMRGAAIDTLLRVVEQRPDDADAADRLLEMVLARKNEQDPVRQNMFVALVAWKRETWKQKHTKVITQMLRDALDASDLSPSTAMYAESLLIRCFHLDPPWAAAQLGIWLKERGQLTNPNLGAHLEDDDVKAAASVLLSIADAWTSQERYAMVIGLATSLAERMKLIPGFFDVVERARDRCPWGGWAVQLAKLLREHAPERHEAAIPTMIRTWLDKGWHGEITALANDYDLGDNIHEDIAMALERIIMTSGTQWQVIASVDAFRSRGNRRFGVRIERMLAKDPSLVALPVVAQYLHRRRQDLLTPYLEGQRPVTGRFATGTTTWVLPYTKDFWRWTTSQTTLFAGQHLQIAKDTERDTPSILRAMVTMPEMCWAPMNGLIALADDDRPVVKEKAIRVIARCDQGQGIPMLLKCLEDARARIAIYGLRKALSDLPPARSFGILVDVPMKKVTVAKEVLRLIGELRSDEAYAHLLKLDATELHRDVRIALLRALWDHLEREETWAIFDRAVTAPDWIMASRLGDIPADRLTQTSDARLSKLLTRVVTRNEPEARIDLLSRAPQLAIRDPERTFLAACRDRIFSPYDDEVRTAVYAALLRSDESDIPALKTTLEKVHRDDERMMHIAVQSILGFGASRRVFVLATEAITAIVKTDAGLTPTRIRASRTLLLKAEEIAALLEELPREPGGFSSDAMIEARTLIDSVDIRVIEDLEQSLSKSPHPEVRRLAVHALVRDAGKDRGWTEERLERLAHHQRDASDLVRAAAHAIFPPRELAPKRGVLERRERMASQAQTPIK